MARKAVRRLGGKTIAGAVYLAPRRPRQSRQAPASASASAASIRISGAISTSTIAWLIIVMPDKPESMAIKSSSGKIWSATASSVTAIGLPVDDVAESYGSNWAQPRDEMDWRIVTHDFQADIDAVGSIAAVPTILDVVCATTGMGFAAVARVTEGRWIACSILDNVQFGLQPGGELKVETTICHEIRQHRQAVVIDNVAEDPAYRDHHTPAMYGLQSYISMPIVLPDGTFFGTLCAIDSKPRKLATSATIGMFKLFAELIAFHLDAHERIAQSVSRLALEVENSSLREQFIAVLGHDLRNPLASIQSGTTVLLREPQTQRSASIIQLMQQSVSRMAGIIDNVLDFARGRLGGGYPLTRGTGEPLEASLIQVIAEMRSVWPDRTVEAEVSITQAVNCDSGRVAQLFSNLLGNALAYGLREGPVKVRAFTETGMFELSVSNGGDPIPPQALERLFLPFFRADVRPGQQGLGLGLFIVSEIARAHGGTVEVDSSTDETRFTFRMPLSP